MRLTNYTDYSLRVLIYIGTKNREELSNIKEIADVYGISKNHLMKVIYQLGKNGYIETIRGRNGGFRLARPASEINIGDVVRKTEEDFHLVECFNEKNSECVITSVCRLRHVFQQALQAYLQVLDQYTLADLIINQNELKHLFNVK
ncbi:BadM/Rrf2 family transcriptional regulator [Aeribacillus composti]|uniref:Rrf2 family transcriptional regulator n=1 Tax=Aeribacillus TaxID=1055323 RepID=UPI00119A8C28|nr:Rrf2 family transcriptional regulator [Aeribacillus composti]MED0717032.1 Rrf2 family transcriptional regulator [Aeribacillus composti]MED0746679.1 Rrf2 family transcriptional regulator [Aeribacillus composti]TVZ86099.1 BadM/Rrf2 family transcriptional regulator [Aeribacillus composti]